MVFAYETQLGKDLDDFILSCAVIPHQFVSVGLNTEQLLRLTAAMFLHGGWFHLLSNMLYLWIFGDNVESRMGHFRYLVFYLLTGYIATAVHIFFYPLSTTPLIGASGAIAGVLGAYLILYPRAKVFTLIFLFIFIQVIPIPAVIFLGLWFVMQIFSGIAGLTEQTGQGVAFWAHIGGFIAGLLLVKIFSKRTEYETNI